MKRQSTEPFLRRHISDPRTGSAVLLGTFVCVSLLFGCAPEETREAGESAESVEWISLSSSEPDRIPSPSEAVETEYKPWTLQTRVSAIHLDGERAYCAVNGAGFIVIEGLPDSPFSLRTAYDREIFMGKTIGRSFPYDGGIYCNLYTDRVLESRLSSSTEKPPDIDSSALAAFDSENLEIQTVSLPFKEKNPEWELVSLVPRSSETWYFAWKNTSSEGIRFRYTRFDTLVWEENGIEEEFYLEQLKPAAGEKAPGALGRIISHIADNTNSSFAEGHVYDVWLRKPLPFTAIQYRYGNDGGIETGNVQLHTLEAFVIEKRVFVLFGETLYQASGKELGLRRLPSLPEGYVYTRFVTDGKGLVLAAWEEQDFILVGRSGLMILPPKTGG